MGLHPSRIEKKKRQDSEHLELSTESRGALSAPREKKVLLLSSLLHSHSHSHSSSCQRNVKKTNIASTVKSAAVQTAEQAVEQSEERRRSRLVFATGLSEVK